MTAPVPAPVPAPPPPPPPPPDMTVHTIPLDTPVVTLEASTAFELLTPQEKEYAYALGKADWEGAKICLLQCSVESVPIFCLLQLAFSNTAGALDQIKKDAISKAGLTQEEISQAIMYAAAFYGNMGNYKSFGDTKFVPALSPEKFLKFLQCCCKESDTTRLKELWDECSDRMYSLPTRQRQMGLGKSKGITTYFSSNCDESDAKLINAFLDSIGLSAYNTRLFKTKDNHYIVKLASANTTKLGEGGPTTTTEHSYEGNTITVVRGDYSPLMKRVVDALKEALPHTANENQTKMIQHYIESFDSGSHNAHKEGSRFWIQDKSPAVESYIGFIESYRDPSGVRGEWEGFVACVNKEVSRKFQTLVDKAELFLKSFPWPAQLEKDVFLRPDFTSLEVLAFGSSGVPAGINIPNYDDIRQSEGFKNVSLGNVLQASYSVADDQTVSFVKSQDQQLYKQLKGEAFEIQVGIHELLGHGSGKLYHQNTPAAQALMDGGFLHPLTQEPVKGPFYAPDATWGSTFGKISSTYEECRAECSGIFLCLESQVLQVFGVDTTTADTDNKIHDVSYINWLLMARAGLVGLEFYTPDTKEWRQAHMQARYVILRALLEADASGDGGKLLSLQRTTGEDGKPDVEIHLNRDLIATVGRKVIGDLLLKLQVYKSLGDYENGSKFYNEYSLVPEEMIQLREIVMARKEPRKLLIQPHMYKTADDNDNNSTKIELKTFPSTPEGMIQSFAERFPAEDDELMALYHAEKDDMSD